MSIAAGANELELPAPWPAVLAHLQQGPASRAELCERFAFDADELDEALATLAAHGILERGHEGAHDRVARER